MKFACPHCQQPLEADESYAGATVDCPACGKTFVVEAEQPLNRPEPLPVAEGLSAVQEPEAAQKPRQPGGKMKKWMWILAALVVVCVVWSLLGERRPGTTKTIKLPGGARMEMVWCPPGTFVMGRPDGEEWREEGLTKDEDKYRNDSTWSQFHKASYHLYGYAASEIEEYDSLWQTEGGENAREDWEAQHTVILTKGFWIAKTEVTRDQWKSVMGNNPSFDRDPLGSKPVNDVSWDACEEFCKKAGLQLPTEAQWEYACRAGSKGAFGGTGNLDDMGWYEGNCGREGLHVVGTKMPNAWGIYDMHGNVEEWCADCTEMYMRGSHDTVTDPKGSDGSLRIVRGGAINRVAVRCRSAFRFNDFPVNWYQSHDRNGRGRDCSQPGRGFRPVLVP